MNSSPQIAIVFHSVTGTTATLADAVQAGAEETADVSVTTLRIDERDIQQGRYSNRGELERISSAHALIFGSPTFMGCVSAQFKAFADASSEFWMDQRWAGKIATGFTIGSNPSGDQLNTIQYLNIFANQHGMLWTGLDLPGGLNDLGLNRLGAQSGLIAHAANGELHATDIATAKYLGQRVATHVLRLSGGFSQVAPNHPIVATETTVP